MKPGDDETRPARALPARRACDTERHDGGEQDQRDDAGATRREPESVRAHAETSAGQPATNVHDPSTPTRRAGRRRSASHSAGSGSKKAAVLATFASTQVFAATVTVRHGERAGRPVRGSIEVMQLDAAAAPAAHGRRRRREASALERDRRPGTVERRSMVVGDAYGPAAVRALCRRRRCRLRGPRGVRACDGRGRGRDRSHASAFAVAPRSSSTPAGTRTVAASLVELDASASRARCRTTRERRRRRARRRRETSSRSRACAASRPTVGSTRPPLARAASSATCERLEQQRADRDASRRWQRLTRTSSLSGRKRLQARSIASSSRRDGGACVALAAPGPTVAITAVVPSARNETLTCPRMTTDGRRLTSAPGGARGAAGAAALCDRHERGASPSCAVRGSACGPQAGRRRRVTTGQRLRREPGERGASAPAVARVIVVVRRIRRSPRSRSEALVSRMPASEQR